MCSCRSSDVERRKPGRRKRKGGEAFLPRAARGGGANLVGCCGFLTRLRGATRVTREQGASAPPWGRRRGAPTLAVRLPLGAPGGTRLLDWCGLEPGRIKRQRERGDGGRWGDSGWRAPSPMCSSGGSRSQAPSLAIPRFLKSFLHEHLDFNAAKYAYVTRSASIVRA
ncbi:hypothetical protein Taro_054360 [Colocasia esculenta]|uniref:Uncharacterized protein n=1 Tax=Colocasia esculenta TaxID=4460 RepID=A0A843XQC2_COLES|nr:hypothetical protein [Colocasia esculenta]